VSVELSVRELMGIEVNMLLCFASIQGVLIMLRVMGPTKTKVFMNPLFPHLLSFTMYMILFKMLEIGYLVNNTWKEAYSL